MSSTLPTEEIPQVIPTVENVPVQNTDTAYGEIKQLTDLVEQEIISQ